MPAAGCILKFYEALPIAARFILTRERFVEFTMAWRDPLLLKLQDFRTTRDGQDGPQGPGRQA